MNRRRSAWSACVLVVSTIGVAGVFAGGCGGDDDDSTVADAGRDSGVSEAGSDVSTVGDAKSEAKVDGTAAEAGPTEAEKAQCRGALNGDSGGTCISNCFCDMCPTTAVTCLGNADCKAVVDCAQRTGCNSLATCNDSETCKSVLTEHALGVVAATTFAPCAGACTVKCTPSGDASPDVTSDAPVSDAAKEAATSDAAKDAPAADSAADAPATTDAAADAPATTDAAADAPASDSAVSDSATEGG